MKWWPTGYVYPDDRYRMTRNADGVQGYEVSEEEIHLPLDQFKAEYTSGDKGWPE